MNEIKVHIPTTWHDITIKQFTELERLKEKNNNKINRIVEELQILTSLSYEEIEALSLENINELYSKMDFLKTEITSNLVNEFEIFGVKYQSSLEFGKLSYSQYVDLIDVLKLKEDNKYKLAEILAVLFVAEGKKYGETSDNLTDLFYNHLDIVTAYSLTVFFCDLFNSFMQVSQTFFLQQAEKQMKQIVKLN